MVSFSTLEDAWGTSNLNNFHAKDDLRLKKKKSRKMDPLCELYGKRFSEISKPYDTMANDEFGNNFSSYNKNDASRNSKNSNTNKNSRQQEYYPLELDEYSSFASVKGMDNMDDDSYLENALENINLKQSPNGIIDDEDEDVTIKLDDHNKINTLDTNKFNVASTIREIDHSKDNIIETMKDSNYLDFGLYISSGIILIFLFEQILQLGIKMKINN